MTDSTLNEILNLIQEDVGHRGLRTDPEHNLISACPNDFANACLSIKNTPHPRIVIVTGFFIPHGSPPCGETDGPLGAVYLARSLIPLGLEVTIASDLFCANALRAGLRTCNLEEKVHVLPPPKAGNGMDATNYFQEFQANIGSLTHLIALERVGPSHTLESLKAQSKTTDEVYEQFVRDVPSFHHGRCHTMKGRDITHTMSPAHILFEKIKSVPEVVTIGIGDGGNEIGMGKIPWQVVERNIPGGGVVACRIPTNFLVVCGISNWGAYGLAAGIRHLYDAPPETDLFDPNHEKSILAAMVDEGPLVDGVSGLPGLTVDGLTFEKYGEIFHSLAKMFRCTNTP